MKFLTRLLAPVVICAAIVGCSSGSDGESNISASSDVPAVTSPVETDVPAPATVVGEDESAPSTSISLEDLRKLDSEGIADAFLDNEPGFEELTTDEVACVRDGFVELVDSVGVDEFLDAIDTGVAGDPVPTALGEIGKRCGLQ